MQTIYDETIYDETTTTIYDTFSDEVGGELAAIGDSIGHARGDMLQVRQDEHMRDEAVPHCRASILLWRARKQLESMQR